MAFDGTLKFDTKIDDSGFELGLSALGSLAKKGMELVNGAALLASKAMISLGKSALDAYADYEQLTGGVETLFKTSADVVNAYAANAYKTSGLSANEYMETVTSFSAALISSLDGDTAKAAEIADKAITDMSDNANKMGSSMESIQTAYQGFAKQNYTMLDNLKLGYGGTKSEMERLLADAEKISGIHYDLESYADIVDAIHVIQTEMDITGTTAKEAASTISGSVGMTQAAWKNLVVGIADDNQDFDKLMQDFVESATVAATNILPRVEIIIGGLGKLVSGMGDVLSEALLSITDILPELVSAGISLVQTIASAISQNSDKIVSAAMEIGMTLIKGMSDILPVIHDTGLTILASLIKGITANIGMIAQQAASTVKQFAQIIITNVPVLLEAAAELIAEVIQAVTDDLPEFIETAIEVISSIAQALIDNAPIVIDAIIEALPMILDALLDNLPLMIQTIMTIGVQLIQYIPKIFDQLIMMLPDLIGQVIAAVIDNAPLMLEAFTALFSEALIALGEMWNSLSAALDEAIAKIAEYFSIGFSDIKKFFSDVYSEIKEEISKTWSAVKKWGADMVNSAVKTAQDFLDNIVNSFVKIPNKVKGSLSDAFDKVTDWGSNIISKITDIGKNLVKGIWDGIQNMKQWIKERILSFGDVILDSFKSVFGIHSPSAVMRDSVGKYLAQGIGVGFSEEIPEVGKNALKAFESLKFSSPEIGFKAVPEIDSSAFSALSKQDLSIDSSLIQPDISSVINNNYTYNSSSASPENQQEIVINAHFSVGEEVVAQGVGRILLSEADKQQGIDIQLKKRGLTT